MTQEKRNAVFAFGGLLALGIYILACSSSPSFSPDDTKVLYPAFDPVTGIFGMSVYDRETRRSETSFLLATYARDNDTNTPATPALVRGQWLANGKDIVIACFGPGGTNNEGSVTLTVVPYAAHRPVKTLVLECASEDAGALFIASPLCVVGDSFLYRSKRGQLVRVDLQTFALVRHQFEDAKGEVILYPTPDGKGVFYLEQNDAQDQVIIFGRLNPEDFSRTPLMTVTNCLEGEIRIAYDREGKTLVFLAADGGKVGLNVWRDGRVAFSRSVDTHSQKLSFGNAVLTASGKSVLASFAKTAGTNATSYGLMEIPFSQAPLREVTLIKQEPAGDDSGVGYFQAAVSHDGKTAALASTYLGCDEGGIRPEDCALFLVDLSDPGWKVTKVPIPAFKAKPSKRK